MVIKIGFKSGLKNLCKKADVKKKNDSNQEKWQ
jgi:hypothetical protein